MKLSSILNLKNGKWRLRETSVAILIALVISACGNDSVLENPAVDEPSSDSDQNQESDLEPNPNPNAEPDAVPDLNAQFPPDTIDTGTNGMIVTGFDSTNADATSKWLVSSSIFRLNSRIDSSGDATINLLRYDDLPVSSFVDFYTEELDTCEVTDPDATSTGGGADDSRPPPNISGGNSVTINTPSGPWFILNKTVVDGEITYTVNNTLPAELLPMGATLSIPGDEFPTVAAHPLFDPTAAPVRLLPDAERPVTAESIYAWLPGENKTQMQISLLAYNTDGSFVDFAARCVVTDDGAFTMPTEVTNFVTTTPYSLYVRYTRVYSRLDFINGMVIRQRNALAE